MTKYEAKLKKKPGYLSYLSPQDRHRYRINFITDVGFVVGKKFVPYPCNIPRPLSEFDNQWRLTLFKHNKLGSIVKTGYYC